MEATSTLMTEIHEQLAKALGRTAVAPLTEDNLQVVNIASTPRCSLVTVGLSDDAILEISSTVLENDAQRPWLPAFLECQHSRLPVVHFEYVRNGSVLLVVYRTVAAEMTPRRIIDHAYWIARVAEDTRAAIRWAEVGSWK